VSDHINVSVLTAVKALIFMGSAMPYPVQTADNPLAPSRELWDSLLVGFREDFSSFVKASIPGVFGAKAGVDIPPAQQQRFEQIVHGADPVAVERCIQIMTDRDILTEELKRLVKVPILILHGDSDQSMPVEAGPARIKELIPEVEIKLYEKAAHGLYIHVVAVVCYLANIIGRPLPDPSGSVSPRYR